MTTAWLGRFGDKRATDWDYPHWKVEEEKREREENKKEKDEED